MTEYRWLISNFLSNGSAGARSRTEVTPRSLLDCCDRLHDPPPSPGDYTHPPPFSLILNLPTCHFDMIIYSGDFFHPDHRFRSLSFSSGRRRPGHLGFKFIHLKMLGALGEKRLRWEDFVMPRVGQRDINLMTSWLFVRGQIQYFSVSRQTVFSPRAS